MRRYATLFLLAFAVLFLAPATAKAHTVWVMAEEADAGKDGVVILGYGHDFPIPEPIAPERAHIFKTPELIDQNGRQIPLNATDISYRFTTATPLAEGAYLLLCEYQPTIWTTTPSEGAQMLPKTEVTGSVVSSYRFATFAKGIVNVGNAGVDVPSAPVGTVLEIVPQTNPAGVSVGESMKVQVLFEGKPLAGAWVYGLADGYAKGLHDAKAFANRTDRNGVIEFIPWKTGYWQLEVEKRVDLADAATHDYDLWTAKLSFEITQER